MLLGSQSNTTIARSATLGGDQTARAHIYNPEKAHRPSKVVSYAVHVVPESVTLTVVNFTTQLGD